MTFVVIEKGAPQLSIVVFNKRRLSLVIYPTITTPTRRRAQNVRPRLLDFLALKRREEHDATLPG
jgi:hypothetical protein